MSAIKKSVLSISSKLFCQFTSSIFRVNTTTSRASFTSDNSDQYEGDTKGNDANETVEVEEGENEASEMGEKSRESTEKGLENAKLIGEEMADMVEVKIADQSIGDEAKQAVQAAWNAPKHANKEGYSAAVDEESIDYGDDENILDEEHMKKLAKDPGVKPSEEL